MVRERANYVRISKIHSQRNARIGTALSIAKRHVNRISEKGIIHRNPERLRVEKMDLMNVEGVQFIRTILDDPILDVALLDHNVRYVRHRIEGSGLMPSTVI